MARSRRGACFLMLQCGYFLLEAAELGLGEEPCSLSF
jgi:hypothetical protein